METKSKNCNNCKYAIQHYAKLRGRLIKLNGSIHCSSRKIRQKQIEKFLRENSCCQYWQNGEERLEQEKTDTKKLLMQISNQLTDVIMVLNEKNDDKPHKSIDKTGLF